MARRSQFVCGSSRKVKLQKKVIGKVSLCQIDIIQLGNDPELNLSLNLKPNHHQDQIHTALQAWSSGRTGHSYILLTFHAQIHPRP